MDKNDVLEILGNMTLDQLSQVDALYAEQQQKATTLNAWSARMDVDGVDALAAVVQQVQAGTPGEAG